MTKKDYELIASTVKYSVSCLPEKEYDAISFLAHELAYRFAKDNPKFDRDKFLAACGIGFVCFDCGKVYESEEAIKQSSSCFTKEQHDNQQGEN